MNAEYAIVEMGTSSCGEIAYLTDLVKPDIALITNIFPMHIEYFNSVEEIAQEKATIFKGLNGNKKIAIINEDSNCFDILMNKARKYTDNILCYGKNNQPNVDFSLCDDSEQYKYYAWCALSIINSLGLDINKAAKKIADFKPLIGRGKKHSLNIDNGKYTLIDDSYSGQPASMILGIKSLDKQYCKGKKIAVIGKMSELGKHSRQFHIEVGQELAKSSINTVIGVCPETKDILEQLPNSMNKYYFENNEGLADFLLNEIIEEEDVVFIKGAHYSSRVFEVAEKLIETGADK
jgi:UDP-N-acetylmuramyl pentapeptide synthase